MRTRACAGWIAFACLALGTAAGAQDYPSRVVKMVAPFSAGGSTDVLTRITAAQLSERWNHSVVVENRVGASGRIGAEVVAKQSPPDGYTLLVAGAPHAIGVSLFRKLTYDLAKDLVAIANIATFPSVIVVHPFDAVKSVKELIALGRSARARSTSHRRTSARRNNWRWSCSEHGRDRQGSHPLQGRLGTNDGRPGRRQGAPCLDGLPARLPKIKTERCRPLPYQDKTPPGPPKFPRGTTGLPGFQFPW